ncbi:hypothetical protein M9Y10_007896 [Tritrichomonas musculus]|uniref:Protein kinase domain-containing protein n=1 Tax=Tritrichomonas musculus TaxID=1915356 RepID=A0ABR2J2L5_9EUKA
MFNLPPRKCGQYALTDVARPISTTNNSCVHQATKTKTGEKVILKFIPLTSPDFIKNAENECTIQSSLKHPFVMSPIISNFTHRRDSYRLLEMQLGLCSLAGVHEKIKDLETIYKIMYQMSLGVCYLHDMRVLHGDIKPENFVLMKDDKYNPEIRIIDFGSAYHFKEEDMSKCIISLPSGTTIYNPPELLADPPEPHSFPIDIWSLGATFYYLITGELVLNFSSYKKVMYDEAKSILFKYNKKFGPQFDESGKDLIKNMMKFYPEQRLTAKEVLESPFFNNVLDHEWIEMQHMIVTQGMKNNEDQIALDEDFE